MTSNKNHHFLQTVITLALALTLGSCQNSNSQQTSSENSISSLPGTGVSVTPTYALLEEMFQTEIVNIGLRKLGYNVESGKELDYASAVAAIGTGDIDYTAVHWQRNQRRHYTNGGGDEKLEVLGVIVEPVLQGYLIDQATAEEYDITSLKQLQKPEIAKLFDSDGDGRANLVGCNTGWACGDITTHHIDEYGLSQTVEHDQGKYIALFADVISRYEQGEPVLYYAWTPFWGQEELVPGKDVKWLEVPYTSLPEENGEITEARTTAIGKNLGFPVDQMVILANQNFVDTNPIASKFMELVTIPTEDVSAQNKLMQAGEDSPEAIRRHAQEWVNNHQETFDQWLTQARQQS